MQVISPGLIIDLVCTVLDEHGYDVARINVTDLKGYLSSSQEQMMEIAVTKLAVGIVNDLDHTRSYLDNYLSLDKFHEIDGTCYSIVNGQIVCQDYHFKTKVYRTASGRVHYDSTAVQLSDLVSCPVSNSETVPVTTPSGTYKMWFIVLQAYKTVF